jgi:hypothetical protein
MAGVEDSASNGPERDLVPASPEPPCHILAVRPHRVAAADRSKVNDEALHRACCVCD